MVLPVTTIFLVQWPNLWSVQCWPGILHLDIIRQWIPTKIILYSYLPSFILMKMLGSEVVAVKYPPPSLSQNSSSIFCCSCHAHSSHRESCPTSKRSRRPRIRRRSHQQIPVLAMPSSLQESNNEACKINFYQMYTFQVWYTLFLDVCMKRIGIVHLKQFPEVTNEW